jgi:hypothetical protein
MMHSRMQRLFRCWWCCRVPKSCSSEGSMQLCSWWRCPPWMESTLSAHVMGKYVRTAMSPLHEFYFVRKKKNRKTGEIIRGDSCLLRTLHANSQSGGMRMSTLENLWYSAPELRMMPCDLILATPCCRGLDSKTVVLAYCGRRHGQPTVWRLRTREHVHLAPRDGRISFHCSRMWAGQWGPVTGLWAAASLMHYSQDASSWPEDLPSFLRYALIARSCDCLFWPLFSKAKIALLSLRSLCQTISRLGKPQSRGANTRVIRR